MPQSGSYNFSTDRNTLITDAMLYIGVLAEGATASANAITEAARLLNMIVKLRASDGMPAWAIKRGYVLPVTGVSSINTDSHIVDTYDATTLTSTMANGATTVDVTSNTGIATSDQIGIEQTGGTMQWTTVTAIAGSVLTLGSVLTGAAADGGRIYTYTASTDRVKKPIRVIQANRLDVADSISSDMDVISEDDYFRISDRTSASTPSKMFYTIRPSTDTALDTNGQVFMHPRFSNGDDIIEFTYQRPLQDFDASTDEPDFPQAFYLPLMLELAALLGSKAGLTLKERLAIFNEAKAYREEALSTIASEGSYRIIPDIV